MKKKKTVVFFCLFRRLAIFRTKNGFCPRSILQPALEQLPGQHDHRFPSAAAVTVVCRCVTGMRRPNATGAQGKQLIHNNINIS